MKASIEGLLNRPPALGIRAVTCDVFAHPEHDPGCRLKGDVFLRLFQRAYRYALLIFDRQGCGSEDTPPGRLQEETRRRLASSGWGDRAGVVVIDPELEVWVWSDSPEVDAALGWGGGLFGLRSWLADQGLLRPGDAKPAAPKTAMERALREAGKPRSSSIFGDLASRVSLERCTDPSFLRLKALLREWFAAR